jgi:acyl-CoA thioesterase-2
MTSLTEALESPLEELLENLDLEALDADLFLGNPGKGEGRLFGGMVAAQSVMAAGHTVPRERRLHSLHAYFLRPGRHDVPLRFVVDRIRDGRSFTTRRVKAHQAGEAIFNLSASFCLPEEGIAHQDPMPEAPPPEHLSDWEVERAKLPQGPPPRRNPIEVRMADPFTDEPSPARQRNWLRVRGSMPEDPLLHTAMLVYASDRTLLGTAARPHGIAWKDRMSASLDHAMWIHHEVRLDGWILYTSESPIAHGAHGMSFGALYYPDGRRLASVAQEGLIRRLNLGDVAAS